MEFRGLGRVYRKLQWLIGGKAPPRNTQCSPLSTLPVLHEGFNQEFLQASIERLQGLLQRRGFLYYQTGQFDEVTKLAVEAFQQANELLVDGVVGPLTWAALLYPTLSRSESSSADLKKHVRKLQLCLHQERFRVKLDGVFGARTERALKRFQKRYGLQHDGICGPVTWSL